MAGPPDFRVRRGRDGHLAIGALGTIRFHLVGHMGVPLRRGFLIWSNTFSMQFPIIVNSKSVSLGVYIEDEIFDGDWKPR